MKGLSWACSRAVAWRKVWRYKQNNVQYTEQYDIFVLSIALPTKIERYALVVGCTSPMTEQHDIFVLCNALPTKIERCALVVGCTSPMERELCKQTFLLSGDSFAPAPIIELRCTQP
jgi:hypothetical protein